MGSVIVDQVQLIAALSSTAARAIILVTIRLVAHSVGNDVVRGDLERI
jgi:hypothetical protein